MYDLVVFLHVFSVLAFLLGHGVTTIVIFLIERQQNIEQVRVLLTMRRAAYPILAGSAMLILITGVIAGLMANWWRMGWIWAALVLFLAVSIIMSLVGRRYFDRLALALNSAPPPSEPTNASPMLPPQLSSLPLQGARPIFLTVLGVTSLAVILWLMMFKPF